MNKQSKPTKRQMRNLKVVRWEDGTLWVGNTKTQRYHCHADPFDKETEDRMIREVAEGGESGGPDARVGQIHQAWNGYTPYPNSTQIRL